MTEAPNPFAPPEKPLIEEPPLPPEHVPELPPLHDPPPQKEDARA